MRVKADAPKSVDKDRCRYYRLRVDRLEQQNAETRAQYVKAGAIRKGLTDFCGALQARIDRSALDPVIKTELREDMVDWLSRLSLPGTNGQRHKRRRNGKSKAK
jgi:hypothetical protein